MARRISDRHLLRLIKLWLEAPVEEIDEEERGRDGAPWLIGFGRVGLVVGSPVLPRPALAGPVRRPEGEPMTEPFASPRLFKVDLANEPDHLAFNPANNLLAVGSEETDSAVVLDLADGREVARFDKDKARSLYLRTFAFFGDKLLTIQHRPVGECVLFDVHKRSFAPKDQYPQGAAIDPTGRFLAIGFHRTLVLYDLKKQAVHWQRTTVVDGTPVRPAFSPGGRYVAADFGWEDSGGVVVVWDTAEGKRWRTLEVSSGHPVVAFQGDTLSLAIGEYGIGLYEPGRGDEPVAKFSKPRYPEAVAYRDGGKTLAAVGYDDGFVLVDLAAGKEKWADRPKGHEIGYSVPSPDWSLVASVTKGGVLVWSSGLGE